MSDFTTDAVVGGIGTPRIVAVGENECENPRLTTDITGWESNNALITLSRVEDNEAYEQYMLSARHCASVYDYFKYTAQLSQNLLSTEKKILVALRIKDISLNEGGTCEIQNSALETVIKIDLVAGGTLLGSKEIILTDSVKRISMIFEGNWSVSSTSVELRIYTGIEFEETGEIRIDDVYINLINADYNFNCSQQNHLVFQQVVIGQHEMMDGDIQQYNKTWRPNYFGHWEIFTKQEEIFRQKVAEADKIFIFPHLDFLWGFFGLFIADFKRQYPFNRYIGHDSEISIRGSELLVSGITPDKIAYVPPVITYTLVVGSVNPPVGVAIIIDVKDYNNQGNGNTEFVRTYEENVYVTLTAPDEILDGTTEKTFVQWQDENDTLIAATLSIKIQMTEAKEVYAKYEGEAPPVGGYGKGYGSLYGKRL